MDRETATSVGKNSSVSTESEHVTDLHWQDILNIVKGWNSDLGLMNIVPDIVEEEQELYEEEEIEYEDTVFDLQYEE